MKLALREQCIDEIKATVRRMNNRTRGRQRYQPKVPDIDLAKPNCFGHPVVLRVAIPVLVRPQSMRDALDRIYHGTGKVVRGIHFPFIPGEALRKMQRKVNDETHPVR